MLRINEAKVGPHDSHLRRDSMREKNWQAFDSHHHHHHHDEFLCFEVACGNHHTIACFYTRCVKSLLIVIESNVDS